MTELQSIQEVWKHDALSNLPTGNYNYEYKGMSFNDLMSPLPNIVNASTHDDYIKVLDDHGYDLNMLECIDSKLKRYYVLTEPKTGRTTGIVYTMIHKIISMTLDGNYTESENNDIHIVIPNDADVNQTIFNILNHLRELIMWRYRLIKDEIIVRDSYIIQLNMASEYDSNTITQYHVRIMTEADYTKHAHELNIPVVQLWDVSYTTMR